MQKRCVGPQHSIFVLKCSDDFITAISRENAVSDLSTAFSCENAVFDLSTAFSRENAVSDLSTAFSYENAVLDLSTAFSCQNAVLDLSTAFSSDNGILDEGDKCCVESTIKCVRQANIINWWVPNSLSVPTKKERQNQIKIIAGTVS